ncbi:MAG TPA: PDZ domain-containing protein [Candidatus Acidoferrum sp.]|jgi:tricorn protease|nr:PDZ domain-containing protein [Candidatus Acidoferrum sp.]
MKRLFLLVACLALPVHGSAWAQPALKPLLMQSPTLSQTHICFAYGGNIWVVARAGGEARRLVAGSGLLSGPVFSPAGTRVAYTGDYDGNQDVYVVAAGGGEPRRLTSHPATDVAVGWTPDGKTVLFRSTRSSYSRFERLFTVSVDGGLPAELPLPMGVQGTYSADGKQLAYVPRWNRRLGAVDAYIAIKQYRGGLTSPIWIANLEESHVEKLPRENSNDFNPMWSGGKIYFLSDRSGPVTLFSYDLKSHEVKQLVANDGFDLKSAALSQGAIVYEQLGALYLYDLTKGKTQRVPVTLAGDMAQLRPHFETLGPKKIDNAALSPSGARAVFEAHGEIFTVPAEKGDIRNLTRTPREAERDPTWSPDGKWIAYFSDESGEYALHLKDPGGLLPARKIDLGTPPSFFYEPVWSPDSKKIAYRDKRLNLWFVEIDKPTPVKVDTDRFDSPLHRFDAVWSPDSAWLAYTKQLENHLRAVFVYELARAKATRVTDGMSDALFAAFDANGKYLYFTASTDIGLSTGWLDMTSEAHPVTRSAYVVVLKRDEPSPLAPESDEEKGDEAKKEEDRPLDTAASADRPVEQPAKEAAKVSDNEKPSEESVEKGETKDKKSGGTNKEPVKVVIDFEHLDQRVLALPIPARNYLGLAAGKEGILYLEEGALVETGGEDAGKVTVQRFDLKTRKTEKLVEGVTGFHLAAKGAKMLYLQDNKWYIAAADKAPKAGEGALKLDNFEVYVEPREEWRQMYNEVWRIERDFFYDPHYHGLDLGQARRAYEPFLDGVASRADLNYLFADMLANLNVLHMYVGGGMRPEPQPVKVGLLGADYKLENGRYRFARVFDGENWNPQLKAPLTQPGVNVQPGGYLLAVNGRDLRATDEVYGFFLETAGKQVVLKVGPDPDGTGAREVNVVPVDSEAALRSLAWIEGNRRKVTELSGGRLAYVYLPNTAGAGFTNFNRYYFAQVGKEGAVIDERFNGGGQLADYIIDYLRRPLLSFNLSREGETGSSPQEAIYGPKAMIINEFAGSGGDAMPWYFRKTGIGPLIGERTWGGLVGIGGYPPLMDGGRVTAPRWALYGLKGEWEVENHGIAPDVEVELDPQLVRQGHDPQLEKAVAVVLDALQKNPLPKYPQPAYPDYHPHVPTWK